MNFVGDVLFAKDMSRVFTIFWVFPVSSFVALVSIGNISSLWPALVCIPLSAPRRPPYHSDLSTEQLP